MKSKMPKLFFDDEDITMCLECMNKNCLCDTQIQQCKCDLNTFNCSWPSEKCPCPSCLEIVKECICEVKIKKDSKNVS